MSRSRLAHRSDSPRVHFRPVVFLHAFAVYVTPARRQWVCERRFHRTRRLVACADACISATGQSEAEGRSEHCTVFHACRFRGSYLVLPRIDFWFSQTEESTPAN